MRAVPRHSNQILSTLRQPASTLMKESAGYPLLIGLWLLVLVPSSGFAQSKVVDSLLNQLNTYAPGDTNRTAILNQLSEQYWYTSPAQGMRYAKEALALAASQRDKRMMIRAQHTAGACAMYMNNYPLALGYFQQEYNLSQATGQLYNQCISLISMANVHASLKEYTTSVRYLKQILELADQLANSSRTQALLAHTYLSLGRAFVEQDSLNQALIWYEKGRRGYEAIGDATFTYEAYSGIADIKRKQGKLTEALTYLKRSLQLFDQMFTDEESNLLKSSVLLRLGEVYLQNKQYKPALYWAEQANQTVRQTGNVGNLSESYLLLSQIHEQAENTSLALRYYKRGKALADSMLASEKTRQISELQARFETKQKDQQIKTLQQQSQIQELQAQRQQTTNQAIGGGLLLMSLLAGVSFNRYRLKQRANQQLQAQQVEINQKNESLEQLLKEKDELLADKELLMKEIHHRVKNNLQIILSLLDSQTAQLKDEGALWALQESQGRVRAISLIHQFLYNSANVTQLNMQGYVHTLVDHLRHSMQTTVPVRYEIEVAPVYIDVDVAVPIGLILNELITNCIKHAFNGQADGVINITFQAQDERNLELIVADNGRGLPQGFVANQRHSLGLRLVQGLARQIKAQVIFENHQGCTARLSIPAHRALSEPQPTTQTAIAV